MGDGAEAAGDGNDAAMPQAGDPVASLLSAMDPALAEMREAFDAATFRTVLSRFAQDARERVEALDAASGKGNVAEIRREAHKLAGILGQVGLADVAARARATSHAGEDAEVLAATAPLLSACRPALAALTALSGREHARAG